MDYGRWLRAMAAQHALDVEQVRAGYRAGKISAEGVPAETWQEIVAHDALVEDE